MPECYTNADYYVDPHGPIQIEEPRVLSHEELGDLCRDFDKGYRRFARKHRLKDFTMADRVRADVQEAKHKKKNEH